MKHGLVTILISGLAMYFLTFAWAAKERTTQFHDDLHGMPLVVITSTQEAERHGIVVLAEESGVPSDRVIDVTICIPRDKEAPQGVLPIFIAQLKDGEKTRFRVSYEPSRDYYRDVVGSHYITTMQVERTSIESLYVEMIYLDEDKTVWKHDPPGGFVLVMRSLLRVQSFDEYTAGLIRCGYRI